MYSFLVVDDEYMICKSICLMLERSDLPIAEVKGAFDGKGALELMNEKAFDFVITDIRMPKMDGLELCREIYGKWPDTSILVVSGYGDFKYAQQAMNYGVKSYLLKPLDQKELVDSIKGIAKKRKASDSQLYASRNEIDVAITGHNNIISAAKHYVEEHYSEDISLDDIGAKFNLNSCYFSQLFRQKTGKTFVEYRTEVRIRKAMELLSLPEMTVTEVAFNVGYQSSTHFFRAFKKYTGLSPTEFRDKRREGK